MAVMSYAERRFGPATVHALCDGVGPFFRPRREAFPQASPAHWAEADRLDPAAAGPDGQWILHFHCYAVRFDDGTTVLVDAGIGPADAPSAFWAPVPGHLPEQLARAGITPDEVGIVLITHLHTDHVGWAATARQPYFRNARYVLQRDDAAAAEKAKTPVLDAIVRPLRDAGQLDLLDGRAPIVPGLTAVPTPGHTPGHQCALLTAGDRTLAITGDLVLHAVHLVDPAIGYEIDDDQERARRSRIGMLDSLPDGTTLATAHLTEPFHLKR
jgi:glyoxylase-like metal-dependent hydrolase (beta-lactamase superfamily II)